MPMSVFIFRYPVLHFVTEICCAMWSTMEHHFVFACNWQTIDLVLCHVYTRQLHYQQNMEYLGSTMETLICDILICWQWLPG